MTSPLKPPVKTTITGEGTVVHHDVTRKGLYRLKVECQNKYPTVETWSAMLPTEARQMACWTEDRMVAGSGFIGVLWIFYKMEGSK